MDERKAAILEAVVKEYIDTAQPVGSSHVAGSVDVAVSAATVRNEMAALEQEGYLLQPHTSAGRIPTDKGYRYFVDSLVGPTGHGPLTASQRQQVKQFFDSAHGAIEEMLCDTSRLLSSVTDYAGVVVGPDHQDSTVRSVQLVGLEGLTAVVVAVLSDGSVEKAVLDLGQEINQAHLGRAGAHLSAATVGSTMAHLPEAAPSGDPMVDELCASALGALRDGHSEESSSVFMGGASRMAAAFDAVESVRKVLAILEQQYVVVTLLRDVLSRGLTVAIGTEHGVEPLSECSVIVAPYLVDGERAGTIGLLGPTRMHYPEAMAAVAAVSKRLSHVLSEG